MSKPARSLETSTDHTSEPSAQLSILSLLPPAVRSGATTRPSWASRRGPDPVTVTSQAVVSRAGGVGGGEDSGDDGIVGADDGVSDPVPQQDVVSRTAPIRAAAPRSRHLEAGLAAALGEWVTAFMLAPLRFDGWAAVGSLDPRGVLKLQRIFGEASIALFTTCFAPHGIRPARRSPVRMTAEDRMGEQEPGYAALNAVSGYFGRFLGIERCATG